MADMIGVEHLETSKAVSGDGKGDVDIEATVGIEKTGDLLPRTQSRVRSNDSVFDPGPPPDGGFRAWSMAFAAHLVLFNTWGFINR